MIKIHQFTTKQMTNKEFIEWLRGFKEETYIDKDPNNPITLKIIYSKLKTVEDE